MANYSIVFAANVSAYVQGCAVRGAVERMQACKSAKEGSTVRGDECTYVDVRSTRIVDTCGAHNITRTHARTHVHMWTYRK